MWLWNMWSIYNGLEKYVGEFFKSELLSLFKKIDHMFKLLSASNHIENTYGFPWIINDDWGDGIWGVRWGIFMYSKKCY